VIFRILGFVALAVGLVDPLGSARAQTSTPVLTRSYNNERTGANLTESVLTPDAVTRMGLDRLRLPLAGEPPIDDPRIEAQPLYMPSLLMQDGKRHDVIFVCSMGNSVYAYDAGTGHLLAPYPISLGPPVPIPVTNVVQDVAFNRTNTVAGIWSTPVIDPDTNIMYIVNKTTEPDGQPVFRLNAIDLVSGQPRHPPQAIRVQWGDEPPYTTFDPAMQKQRAALLLAPLRQTGTTPLKKVIYMACGLAHELSVGRHGWVIAFDPDTLKSTASWCSTPHGTSGGIWQSGQGPAADEQGNVYVITSPGNLNIQKRSYSLYFAGHLLYTYDYNEVIDPTGEDHPESFVKLHYTPPVQGAAHGSLDVAGWWTAFRDSDRKIVDGYDFADEDLGSSGAVLPPGTNFVMGAGKDGILYVFDRDHLGNAFQEYSALKQNPPAFITYDPPPGKSSTGNLDFFGSDHKTHHLHGSPVVWNCPDRGLVFYLWGENEHLRAYSMDPTTGHVVLWAKGAELITTDDPHGGMPGGFLTLSANGTAAHTGIVWATAPIHHDSTMMVGSGILRAYDAAELDANKNSDGTPRLKLLWDSVGGHSGKGTNAQQEFPFTFDKFCPPVVADGRVLVATYDGHIDVYTLRNPAAAKDENGPPPR
jgi:outer membrane protein assembly factor BamB